MGEYYHELVVVENLTTHVPIGNNVMLTSADILPKLISGLSVSDSIRSALLVVTNGLAGCVVLEMFAGKRPWSKEEMVGAIFKLGSLRQAPPIPDDVEGKFHELVAVEHLTVLFWICCTDLL